MSICDGCIHDYVCGLEDNHEEGIVSCVDRIPKDVLSKIKAEIEQLQYGDYGGCVSTFQLDVLQIIDHYRNEVKNETDN